MLLVTASATVATCTDAPLLTESVVTTAVRLPTAVGCVVKPIVSAGRRRASHRADGAVIEGHAVVGRVRIEAKTGNRQSRRSESRGWRCCS